MYKAYISLPNNQTPEPSEIRTNPKFHPYFKDCLGAIDGSHFQVTASVEQAAACRNRKGFHSQNVLAACTFDLKFCYLLIGWEGSAADGAIFLDARAQDLHIPFGKYYLADAGFPGCDSLLVPYHEVRYHLREWGQARLRYVSSGLFIIILIYIRPQNPKELFNLRHASARNAVERIFGIFKKRFKILTTAGAYSLRTQAKFVAALAVIHNFIATHDPVSLDVTQADFGSEDEMELGTTAIGEEQIVLDILRAERTRADEFRDKLAQKMWEDYQAILERRRQRRQHV